MICNNVEGEMCDAWGIPCPYKTKRKVDAEELPCK